MSAFAGAKNVRIGKRARFQITSYGSETESLEKAMHLLVSRVVKGAMHNSEERFDAPTCHEDTRIAIQEDILVWADELVEDLNDLVTWLYGAAGSGKSAIAQTIAEKLHKRGQLTASFFFSQASNGGRGEETDFVATLAHQLSQSVPATKPYIAAAIRDNPLVFDLALRDQVDALIVAPLVAVFDASSGFGPKIIVVDGLDECRQEKSAQRRVVDALILGLRRIPHHTHKLFITSRPEHKIASIFEEYGHKLVRRMELNDTWEPDNDIRTFLNSGFADIRRSHFYFQGHHVDKTWPSSDDVETLVCKSSGQFIYPSVVLKYIKSEENYNPVTRLDTILQLKNNEDRPYAELDALYEHVLSRIRGVDVVRVLSILSLERELKSNIFKHQYLSTETLLSGFMGVHMDEIKFWLRPLVSLLVWREESEYASSGINYMHASLVDYLVDRSRSDVFCISTPTLAAEIVSQALQLMEAGAIIERPDFTSFFIVIPCHYADILSSDEKFHIHSLIHDFNIVENVLCQINDDFIGNRASMTALAYYLNWVLAESEAKTASHSRQALLKPVTQIQSWLVNQFRQLQGNNMDGTKRYDIWPFFTCRGGDYHTCHPDTRAPMVQVVEVLFSAVAICGSLARQQLPPILKVNLSHQTTALCFLMSDLTKIWSYEGNGDGADSWLLRPDLLGQYAMTKERYWGALQHITYYLLQLPKLNLAGIFSSNKSRMKFWVTPVVRLVYQVLPTLLRQSLTTTALYFLVVLTYPIMACIVQHDATRQDLSDSIGDALREAQDKFPFLDDSASLKYIQARAEVEETCTKLGIKSKLPEVAHMLPEKVVWAYGTVAPVQWKNLLEQFASMTEASPSWANTIN